MGVGMKINMYNFGDTVKKERKSSHFTQVELAKSIGCSRRYIQSIESGKLSRLPPLEIIIGLMAALNVSFKDLLPEISSYNNRSDGLNNMSLDDILSSPPLDISWIEMPEN